MPRRVLERSFAACRTNHSLAALKLHAVISVSGKGPRSVKVTAERVHDGPVFRVGPWVEDRLLLFDLAYFPFQLFTCIRRNGGYFVVRLKKSADPTVVALGFASLRRATTTRQQTTRSNFTRRQDDQHSTQHAVSGRKGRGPENGPNDGVHLTRF
jgi:IS4 transposase